MQPETDMGRSSRTTGPPGQTPGRELHPARQTVVFGVDMGLQKLGH